MTVQGRNVRFKVKDSIDRVTVQWLKERTITVIFRDAARFLPRNVKEDLSRAYEVERIQAGDFGEGLSRGRVKLESLSVASYVAKSTIIFSWLVDKRSAEVVLGGDTYRMEFKPWLTTAQVREQRRLEDLSTFWVIAVQVPLDAMFYLESHIRRAIGPVTLTHPPERDRQKPALVNIKFDLEPEARPNMKDSIIVDTFEGDELEVKLASSDTPRCRKCRAFFHTADECRRGGRSCQQQGSAGGQGGREGMVQESSARQLYQGPLGRGGASAQPAASSVGGGPTQPLEMGFANVFQNPAYMAVPQVLQPNAYLAQLLQELAIAQASNVIPFGYPSGLSQQMGNPGGGGGFQLYQEVQNRLQPSCLFPGGSHADQQGGTGGGTSSSQTPTRTDRPNLATPGGRTRGNTPGKHRRVDSEGQDEALREASASSLPGSEGSGDQETIIGTPGMNITRRRTPMTISRGQLDIVENRILPFICPVAKGSFSVIAWSGGDGVPKLFSTGSPEQPMPTTVTNIIQVVVRGKFLVRLIPDATMGRFILDLENGRKLKFFVPIFDAHMESTQQARLEQEGMRLLPLTWFAEGRRQELRRIRVPPFRTGEFLAEINGKLPRDKQLNSKFIRDFLSLPWDQQPSISGTANLIQHATGNLAMNG
ncbi:hypothetical protein CBR_g19287 [Chara braunii]|uniref:Uncharacterized protein n=1 Tax=Chara braunii TaxID=69332 RepID=A0A388KXK4_CHABU|nr:hypothetical protein CBR_g19287 [Chara braunii]|eukprot:GBG74775.1 hypothetical protein CBR_g19287 [Chara braunii]